MKKIVTKKEFEEMRNELKRSGKKIILCHGVFDLIHYGHILHFEEAKKLGDILVVSITGAKFVRKGPQRPYFNDEQRLHFLASIEAIDFVLLSESYTVEDVMEVVRPDLYVKGKEYKDAEADVTGKISEETELVKKYGGEIYFTNGEKFSSTKLINHAMPVFSEELRKYLESFCENYGKDELLTYIHKMKELKVLVVGDIIIDEYIFCKIQGIMSKNIGYSAKFIRDEKYLGGSIAIARHLAEFSEQVTLLSVMGTEKELQEKMINECNGIQMNIVKTDRNETIIKKRYVEADDKRKILDKIFAINNIPEVIAIDKKAMKIFKDKLNEAVADVDVVFLCDFGHGLIDKETIKIIEKGAKKIVLNCQTNSSNYGTNLITKYHRADYFTLDEKELKLAFSDNRSSQEELLSRLAETMRGKGCLTRGSKGAMYIYENGIGQCPAFTLDVADTIGAGDAFFSLFGLMATVGAPVEAGAFMGNIAGALASNIIGNKEQVQRADILKYMCTLLNI